MSKLVIGLVLGLFLAWGAHTALQAHCLFDSTSNVASFSLRKTPFVDYASGASNRLSSPQIQVLYDNRGFVAGVEYENQYGQSYLYDGAGRYQGMIQPQIQPVSNK